MSESTLETYRAARSPLPRTMLRWHLYGSGLENLGHEGKPEEVEVPAYGPDELLVRQDACGLCFSDTKVIGLGPNHPRMTGRDLATQPVTLGHEVSCTVVGVGENLKDRYRIGDRFVVQADVFYQGKSMAYGYVISGGLAEYSVIPKPILEGDEGCYLLPIQPETGYVESALTEPWACVVSAYEQTHRQGLKPGGEMLVVGPPGPETGFLSLSNPFRSGDRPGRITVVCIDLQDAKSITGFALPEIQVVVRPYQTWPDTNDWAALKQSVNSGTGFDDILIYGAVPPEVIEGAATTLADHGILNFTGDWTVPRKLSLDIGRIHYNWHHYLGTAGDNPAEAYTETRTADLLPGGKTWIIGAGGPMGQMHVQRAVQHKKPPWRIVCTDVDAVRLQSVADRFGPIAKERGIELVTLNPKTMSPEAYDAEIHRLGEGQGYDDILSMVPVAALIEHAADYLADGGWFNIFAGVARGTMANLDVNRIVRNRVRYLGSSGSSLSDMRATLARVEDQELSTNASLAAIGGMSAAREGLQAVKEGWFPGKTLIFPLIHDLPLTPLPELKEKLPTVYARLKDGQFWTREAEEELLRLYL